MMTYEASYVIEYSELISCIYLLPYKFTEEEAIKLWTSENIEAELANDCWDFFVNERIIISYETETKNSNEYLNYHNVTKDYPFMNMSQEGALYKDNAIMKQYKKISEPPNIYQEFVALYQYKLFRVKDRFKDLNDIKRQYIENNSLSIEKLSILFDSCFGERDGINFDAPDDFLLLKTVKKNIPSGGGMHPIEIFYFNYDKNEMLPGLYHYNVREHALDCISKDVDKALMLANVLSEYKEEEVTGALVVTSLVERAMWRYRESRSWRAVLIDAGHAVKMFNTVAKDLSINNCNICNFNSAQIAQLIGIDNNEQPTLALSLTLKVATK